MARYTLRESLFEKLSNQYTDGTPLSAVPQEKRLVKSICDHLYRLLNTRQGTLSHMPDYGLPDTAQVYRSLPESLEELKATIARVIEKYEPRLERVKATAQPFNPLEFRMIFEISAYIKNGQRIYLSTSFASSGEAYVNQLNRK
jgi:type VI secretion system protein